MTFVHVEVEKNISFAAWVMNNSQYLKWAWTPHSGDFILRSPEFFHVFRMRDNTNFCPHPDAGSRKTE